MGGVGGDRVDDGGLIRVCGEEFENGGDFLVLVIGCFELESEVWRVERRNEEVGVGDVELGYDVLRGYFMGSGSER